MPLRFYNTLTRKKEEFEPLDETRVRFYVCGPTVYDFAHIGNARPVVVFDVLFRLLRAVYGEDHVVYARNITDVEDKIINRALESGRTIDEITAETTEAFHQDMAALGALPPTVEPRATDHIGEMISMMEKLIEKGYAYAAEGHVLFSVASDPNYGCLSRHNRDDIIAGARVEVAPYKKDPADFVLWKPSTEDQPGWDSPWGRGRPGWHIECSAMGAKHLGETFDIHGGGQDLIFPHHENEIAQSTCAHGKDFVRTWMHNGYVLVNGEKMSKSLGNFFTVRELLEEENSEIGPWKRGEAMRLTLLSAHYRQPLDFTRENLAQSRAQLDGLYRVLEAAGDVEADEDSCAETVLAALSDDLNTPKALSELHEIAGRLGKTQDGAERAKLKGQLMNAAGLLGLLQQDPAIWRSGDPAKSALSQDLQDSEIEKLIEARKAARTARDFTEADRIRDELSAKGILLEDGPGGTTWRRAG